MTSIIENQQVELQNQYIDIAKHCYYSYQSLIEKPLVQSSMVNLVQQRLCTAIYALSQRLALLPDKPNNVFEAFILITAHSMAGNHEQVDEWVPVWFAHEGLREGVENALIHLPLPKHVQLLTPYYHTEQSLRPELLNLWHRMGDHMPDNLLMQGVSQDDDARTQAQALYCAAWQPRFGLDSFRRHYRSLLTNPEVPIEPGILVHALFGGLLRGETNLVSVFNLAMQRDFSDKQYREMMTIAALSGEKTLLQSLVFYSQYHPEPGLLLLALHGHIDAAAHIIAALQQPKTASLASQAWLLLSGELPSYKPRMQVVGSTASTGDMVPDAAAAMQWFEQQPWIESERYLCGQAVTKSHLQSLLHQFSGSMMVNVVALLNITNKQQEYIDPNLKQWQLPEVAHA
tara:strand:+ start:40742 stop:41944 length:1203 start_codon:yes stop_codon:yes gene_type:complete